MSKVAAYSFFRSPFSEYESERCGAAQGRFFINYLPALIRAHHAVWGDEWELWLYTDNAVEKYDYWKALVRMADGGLLKLIPFGECKSLTGIGGMLERMRPAFDWDVEYLMMRDVDSITMPREKEMLSESLMLGDVIAHTIHDSISHSGFCGGLSSLNCKLFREKFQAKSLEEFVSRVDGLHLNWNVKGTDQVAFNSYLVPNLAGSWFIHGFPGKYGNELCKVRKDALPRTCPADRLASHLGGCYDAETAAKWYDQNMTNGFILEAERDVI